MYLNETSCQNFKAIGDELFDSDIGKFVSGHDGGEEVYNRALSMKKHMISLSRSLPGVILEEKILYKQSGSKCNVLSKYKSNGIKY